MTKQYYAPAPPWHSIRAITKNSTTSSKIITLTPPFIPSSRTCGIRPTIRSPKNSGEGLLELSISIESGGNTLSPAPSGTGRRWPIALKRNPGICWRSVTNRTGTPPPMRRGIWLRWRGSPWLKLVTGSRTDASGTNYPWPSRGKSKGHHCHQIRLKVMIYNVYRPLGYTNFA